MRSRGPQIFKTFKNLLSPATSVYWNVIVAKIYVGGSSTSEVSSDGKSLSLFSFCQHELLLEVFKQDPVEKEREYLLMNLKLTWQMSLRTWVQRVEYLSSLCEFLPCLADSKNAPQNLDRVSKSLSKLEMRGLIMRAIPTEWVDQYRLLANSNIVLMDKTKRPVQLEKIETAEQTRKCRVEYGGERIPKKPRNDDGGSGNKKKRADQKGNGEHGGRPKLCALCAKFGGVSHTHRTEDCRKWAKDGTKKATFRSKQEKGGEKKQDYKKMYMQLARILFHQRRPKNGAKWYSISLKKPT